jgi:hypothetical protein
MEPWHTLGIEPTNDVRAIKKAYSIKLKATRPDDDAVAYEAAQWWVQQGLVRSGGVEVAVDDSVTSVLEAQALQVVPGPSVEAFAPDSPAQMEQPSTTAQVVEPSESEPSLAQGPSVERLLQACAALLEQEGETQIVRMWPGLQRQLEDLPITAQHEASRYLAAFVVQQNAPVEVLIALTRHFQWGLDYRADTQLGHELSLALQLTLHQAHVYAALNAQTDPRDIWALALAKLSDQGRPVWLRIVAMCMDHSTRQRVAQMSPLRLRALGATLGASQATVTAAALGGIWQASLLLGFFIVAAHGLFMSTTLIRERADWQSIGFLAALLLGFQTWAYSEFSDLDRWWPYLRHRLRAKGWMLDSLALIPWAVAALLVLMMNKESLDSVNVTTTVPLAYIAIWLVVPTDEQTWRKLFLPTYCWLLVGLAALFPQLSFVVLLSLAFGWVLATHVVLSRFNVRFESIYQGFVKLKFLRKRPFLILGIKLIGVAWLLYVLICLPALLFRLCARRGLLFAQLALVGGTILSFALDPVSSIQWLLACTLAALFAIQSMQWGLQKCADFVLRKIQR